MLIIKKLLVPVDFSETSDAALDYAKYVAGKIGASIEILHIVESYSHNVVLAGDDSEMDESTNMVQEKLNEIKSKLAGVNVETTIAAGKIHKEVNKVSESDRADMIIMGTHGASGIGNLEKYILGSNAYRVVHGSNIPVLTIRDHDPNPGFKRILLPVDVTKVTDQKVSIAIDWARYFASEVHVVSVTNYFDEFKINLSQQKHKLTTIAKEIASKGIHVHSEVLRHESIATEVLNYSKDSGSDLIIILKSQETKWNELFVGSAARKIISEAHTPVMSIRPQQMTNGTQG
ncbi:MAG: universal stress protein [Bacteroidetes bacterium]|nr:universal stress protein [Bacteroidota bacterium]